MLLPALNTSRGLGITKERSLHSHGCPLLRSMHKHHNMNHDLSLRERIPSLHICICLPSRSWGLQHQHLPLDPAILLLCVPSSPPEPRVMAHLQSRHKMGESTLYRKRRSIYRRI